MVVGICVVFMLSLMGFDCLNLGLGKASMMFSFVFIKILCSVCPNSIVFWCSYLVMF